jgi:methyltransferase
MSLDAPIPQIAALLILCQRGLEELHSARNTRRLLASGACEVGRNYYPVVAITHLAWIASIAFLVPPDAPISYPLIGAFLLLQIARYWVIGSLGRYWTHRIITIEDAPLVRKGPYAFMRHPNYAVTVIETLLLPMAFGAVALGIIMTAVWIAVLRYKILLEDGTLDRREREGAASGSQTISDS